MYVACDENGRVMVAVEDERCTDDTYVEVEVPEGVGIHELTDYRLEDGALVHDPKGQTLEEAAAEALANLQRTDYVALKLAERVASGEPADDLLIQYREVLDQRREWRETVGRWRGEVEA